MEYKEYTTTLEQLNSQLDRDGVAVIPDILSNDECARLQDGIWAELNHVTQGRFDIRQKATWREFYNFYPLHSMLLQHFSLGHMQPVWDIRQNPRVAEAFETIWGVDKSELLVSFDGISVYLPPEKTRRGWFRGAEWFHTDQSFAKKDKCCIQGLVNLYPVNTGDATLAVLEGSNKYHQAFNEHFKPECKDDWYKLEVEEKEFFTQKGCGQYAVRGGQGSMMLWDSRTIHQGKEAENTRTMENFRIAVYVCMMPRKMATKKALEKKQKAFNELRMTSHWANNPKLFPKTPRTYGKDIQPFNPIHPPVLNDIGRRLAGFD